jgi:hypothetical protein
MNPELNSERGDLVKSLLLRIDEDIKEEPVRQKPPKHTKENLTKTNSKTEFPELKTSSIHASNRIKNNQSITSSIATHMSSAQINSQTSSRTQLVQLVPLTRHPIRNESFQSNEASGPFAK